MPCSSHPNAKEQRLPSGDQGAGELPADSMRRGAYVHLTCSWDYLVCGAVHRCICKFISSADAIMLAFRLVMI